MDKCGTKCVVPYPNTVRYYTKDSELCSNDDYIKNFTVTRFGFCFIEANVASVVSDTVIPNADTEKNIEEEELEEYYRMIEFMEYMIKNN